MVHGLEVKVARHFYEEATECQDAHAEGQQLIKVLGGVLQRTDKEEEEQSEIRSSQEALSSGAQKGLESLNQSLQHCLSPTPHPHNREMWMSDILTRPTPIE